MPTEDYGGQGPLRQKGEFEVQYTATTPKRGRHDRKRKFTDYNEAKAFYDGVDDSAAIWDVTHYGELCDAKTRVAYFVATAQAIRPPRVTRSLHLISSDEEGAAAHITHRLKQRGWKLLADSVREITETEYQALNPTDEFATFLGNLAK